MLLIVLQIGHYAPRNNFLKITVLILLREYFVWDKEMRKLCYMKLSAVLLKVVDIEL